MARAGRRAADDAEADEAGGLRIDRWLWCTRWFRTRSEAQRAVTAGHVLVNGERAKASRELRIGDVLSVARGPVRWSVTVAGVPVRRGPAPEARSHYTAILVEDRRPAGGVGALAPAPAGRPGKRDRRRLRTLSGKG